MIDASEARISTNFSGPLTIADVEGPILKHVTMTEASTMFDLVEENREFLAKTEHSFADFTLADAKRARNLVAQLAQVGSMFEYWILDNGKPAGDIQLLVPSNGPKPEMGYWISEHAQGKGLATRAARTMLEFGFTLPYVDEVTMWIRPENTASQL